MTCLLAGCESWRLAQRSHLPELRRIEITCQLNFQGSWKLALGILLAEHCHECALGKPRILEGKRAGRLGGLAGQSWLWLAENLGGRLLEAQDLGS